MKNKMNWLIAAILLLVILAVVNWPKKNSLNHPAFSGWAAYSVEGIEECLDAGAVVLIFIRSNYETYSTKLVESKLIEDLRSKGKIATFELQYEWDNAGLEQEYFDRFGRTKDPLLVFLHNETQAIAMPAYKEVEINRELLARSETN